MAWRRRGWLDSHCHLPADTADELVAEARGAGVTTMVTVGCDRASSIEALAVAGRLAGVHATVGLHPHEARHGVDTIRDLFAGPVRPVAVGECGLDYHYDHSPRDDQRTAFAAQVALAHELALPLVIHTREAWDDTFDVLDAEGVPPRTIFHCFTGGPDEARRCLDRGAVLSFSGIVTFKRRARGPRGGRDLPARPAARRDRQPVPGAGARTAASATSPPGCRSSAPAWPTCTASTSRRRPRRDATQRRTVFALDSTAVCVLALAVPSFFVLPADRHRRPAPRTGSDP